MLTDLNELNYIQHAYKHGLITKKVMQELLIKELNSDFHKSPFNNYKKPVEDFTLSPYWKGDYTSKEEFQSKVLGDFQKQEVAKPSNSPTYSKALKELEGMGFCKPIIQKSQPTSYLDKWEIRAYSNSKSFGKIIILEYCSGDSTEEQISKREAKAIIRIWKEARRRLLEGQLVN